ncbi:sulfatase [bacterium]|nr:sulfatase [bacterium]
MGRLAAPPDGAGRGRLLALVLALAALVAPSGCDRPAAPAARHLVLITIDTLRADFLGCYGFPDAVSPRLDALAAEALVFEHAYATAPFTGPSHASILTGQDPSRHGIIYNGHRARSLAIGDDSVTLAEHLGAAGFDTRALVSAGPLDARFGFGRGFDGFSLIPKLGHDDSGADGAEVVAGAAAWLRDWRHAGRHDRFFLWVHLFDPHLPFVSAAGVRDSLGIAFAGIVDETNVAALPRDDVRAAYRAEVFEADRHVGALVDLLAELGLAGETLVAVVSDHGEYLQEHGLVNHHGLRDEVLHVPMLIHWPGLGRSERRPATVSTVDLAPTLCDLLGVGPLSTARGRSLRRAAAADDPTPVFAEWRDFRLLGADVAPRPGEFQVAVQRGRRKLIRDVLFPDAGLAFDLAADPAEDHDLAASPPAWAADLGADLENHIARDLPAGLAGVADIHLDDRALEMLRSLGYVR